jgi:DNA-binding transcriptional ArsR family regulator
MSHKPPEATAIMAQIPAQVLSDEHLGPAAKILFGCIYSLAIHYPKCFISNAVLSERMRLHPRQVKRLLKALQAAGLIERVYDGEHHREEIRVTWQPGVLIIRKRARTGDDKNVTGDKSVTGGVTRMSPGGDKSVTGHSVIGKTNREKTEQESLTRTPAKAGRAAREGERRGSIPTGEYCDAVDRAKRLFGQDIGSKVKDAADVYGSAWVARAIDAAEQHGASNWGYALKCLERWQELGGIPEAKAKRKAEPKRPCDEPYDGPPPPAPDAIPPVEAGARIREIMAGADTSQAKSAT